jgi:hypothetical protein
VESPRRRFGAMLFLATYQTYAVLRDGQIDGFACGSASASTVCCGI